MKQMGITAIPAYFNTFTDVVLITNTWEYRYLGKGFFGYVSVLQNKNRWIVQDSILLTLLHIVVHKNEYLYPLVGYMEI